ncbi:TIGR03560 family F420-dependent LLM class oxidoreductase [Kribbia dieselivorans]|uniref:TIGR03560 family F420-dependent LLM class oxidoreductase n=1 Tax=Kribbia dieselivorans TaxID=331526 RepID=UPI000838FE2E|nr:TIGR03560 family F420-dependent LLM class oxidoreductase [Kribbia dieselivorans]
MRLGLFVPQGWRLDLVGIDPEQHWQVMHEVAAHADRGEVWESVWVYDHFHTVPRPTDEATHEAWALMAALAATTQRVRLGQMCTCVAYRNPAYLAKVAATVDVISGGRLEMGIGAGWYEKEWRAYGYGFPDAPARLRHLKEALPVLQSLWTTGRSGTFDGEFVQVDDAICAPRPLQGTSRPGSPRNGIPTWVAGGGEKVTLKLVAQYADYANFDGTRATFEHKSEVLRGHCERLGRDFDDITRTADYNVVIGRDAAEVEERLAAFKARLIAGGIWEERAERETESLRRQPVTGTPEQVLEYLTGMGEVGLRYAILYFPEAAFDRSGIELFERHVAPELARLR